MAVLRTDPQEHFHFYLIFFFWKLNDKFDENLTMSSTLLDTSAMYWPMGPG